MCGISGVITKGMCEAEKVLSKMESMQAHRGPDIQDQTIVDIDNWCLGLGHQRLSILDLSERGRQPMESSSGDSVIVYNGEVYNYKELREESLDHECRTATDTEIVLEMLESRGVANSMELFNGMWAFAWLDRRARKLYLARDRAGIKPLYYYSDEKHFYFASEVKSIISSAGRTFSLDYQAVGEYLLQSLQDTRSNSFFTQVKAVPAGHYLEFDLTRDSITFEIKRYWNVLDGASCDIEDIEKKIYDLFLDSVSLRLRSDVPVGVTLSGGIDSSAIAAAMKERLGSADNLNILSAVSPGSDLDESEYIDQMVNYLGAKVHKVDLNWGAEKAIELLETVTRYNDSPVGSFSNVAHYLLMKKAQELGITVILSGQGADELLCGYRKYLGFYLGSLYRSRKYFQVVRILFGFLINRTVVNQFSFREAKRYLPTRFKKNELSILGEKLQSNFIPVHVGLKPGQTIIERQAEDLEKYSVPYLTHYEDRMSMAWSREIRLPFLDYRLMELFINLPISRKLSSGWTKYIFRKALQRILPKKIAWRKDKQGFINPQEDWLRSDLKTEVLNFFGADALIFKLGLVDRAVLLHKYEIYCSSSGRGSTVWYRDIFAPFALEVWLQQNMAYIESAV